MYTKSLCETSNLGRTGGKLKITEHLRQTSSDFNQQIKKLNHKTVNTSGIYCTDKILSQ